MTNTEKESKQAKRALVETKKRQADKDNNHKKMPIEKKGMVNTVRVSKI